MGLDIERIFGEQRLTQDEKLKKRKDRIGQLRRERAKQGLSTDMDEIEKQVEAEEKTEKQKRTVRLPEMFKKFCKLLPGAQLFCCFLACVKKFVC